MSDGTVPGDRRWFHAGTAALVAVLVVTAGCSGLPVGGTATEAPSDGGDGGMGGVDTASEQGDGAATDTAGAGASGDFRFSEGDSYRYSAALTNTTSRFEVVWNVTDVSGEELTAEVGIVWNETFRPTQTLTGTPEDIFEGITINSENVAAATFLSLRVGTEFAAGHSLEVGNTWTVTPDELPVGGQMMNESNVTETTAEVTGTDSYGGVECTNVQITTEGTPPSTYCVNPDYPFALGYDTEGVEGSDVAFEGTSVGGSGGSTPTAGE